MEHLRDIPPNFPPIIMGYPYIKKWWNIELGNLLAHYVNLGPQPLVRRLHKDWSLQTMGIIKIPSVIKMKYQCTNIKRKNNTDEDFWHIFATSRYWELLGRCPICKLDISRRMNQSVSFNPFAHYHTCTRITPVGRKNRGVRNRKFFLKI